MNELQIKLEKALAIWNPKWWGPSGQPSRVYFNDVMKGMKVWLQFSNPETLAGAELRARCDINQHPAWIKDQEERWIGKFEAALESVAILRDEAGLDSANEAQPEPTPAPAAPIENIETPLVRLNATTLAEITTEFGNVDMTLGPIGEAFVHIPFPHQVTWAKATKTWLKAAAKGGDFRPALAGFQLVEKRGGKRGAHKWTANEPIIDGVVCLASVAEAIRERVLAIEEKALEQYSGSPAAATHAHAAVAATLGENERVNTFLENQTGFEMMSVGQTRVSANGTQWTCMAAGSNWYVAKGIKL